jgi:hypothetical protein
VSPNRIRRWHKSPVFRKAVAAEIAQPTSAGLRLQIILRGVRESNRVRRERAETKDWRLEMSKARGEDQDETAGANEPDETTPGGLTDKKQLAIELQVIGTKRQR